MSSPKLLKEKRYPRPSWITVDMMEEEDLCPTCFKAVGDKNRYKIICALGKASGGATVKELTQLLGLQQPTVTHHLNILRSVDAVKVTEQGRERIYTLNHTAHCFEDCKIPF